MTYYAREGGYAFVAKSHVYGGVEMLGKELEILEIASIEAGELLVCYQGHEFRIPVEKLMFDRRDLINSRRY